MSSSTVRHTPVSRRKPLAVCVAAVFALSASSAVYATTFTVTDCLDDGSVGSLRWAASQAANSGDVIDMTNITSTGACISNQDGFTNTILLASTVTIADGVTINGPPVPALAVSTNNNGLIFSSPGSITVNDLGITYGRNTKATGYGTVYGGCVYAFGTVDMTGVTLDHCTAYTNVAGQNAKGGAIGVFSATVGLTNSKITNSAAISQNSGDVLGGAVYAYSNVSITGTRVVSGSATANAGNAAGGEIASKIGPLTMSDAYISYGQATTYGTGHAYGGGVYVGGTASLYSGSFVVFSSAVVKAAGGSSAKGGGIFVKGALIMDLSAVGITNATTYSTSAAANALGGSVYGGGAVTLQNSAIAGESSTYAAAGNSRGGGIYSVGLATVDHAKVYANEVSGATLSQGGGIYSSGGLTATYSNIRDNTAKSNSGAGVGGGAFVNNGNSYLRGTSVYGNYSSTGGSALNFVSGGATTATIVNSTISGNSIGSEGGYAVYVQAFTTKFFNSTIAYNVSGSGVYLADGNAGSTVGLYSTLMSSNSYGSGMQNDFTHNGPVTFTPGSSNNLIRNPRSPVPTGTITGKCPFLHKLAFNGGPTPTHRLGGGSSSKNPAIDAGSNPLSLGSDQRGGSLTATSPLRVSGIAADIGAYEVQQADIIFDSEFDTCPN